MRTAISISIAWLTAILLVGCSATDRSRDIKFATPGSVESQSQQTRDSQTATIRSVGFQSTTNNEVRESATVIGAIDPALDSSAHSATGNQPVSNSTLKGMPVERRVDSLETSTSTYAPPITRRSQLPAQFRLISLDEAISIALQDAKVLRSLSANVVQNAPGATTSFNPYIQSSDPNFGISAALAQFDTQLNASALYAANDDYFNNPTTTNNAFEVQQDLTTLNLGLRKTGFNGTQFSFNNAITHDNTTNQSVLFPSSWEQTSELTVRKPLLQGAGYQFNRIAGPNSRPGFLGTSGLLISRINHEVSLGEFERGVRELILEIIEVYWQLDLAYRNFATIKSARDASAATWKIAKARMDNGLPGGEADREAQARAQYLEFELQLDQALHASTDDGRPGVLQAEANLRTTIELAAKRPITAQAGRCPDGRPGAG